MPVSEQEEGRNIHSAIPWWTWIGATLFFFSVLTYCVIALRPGGMWGVLLFTIGPGALSFLASLLFITALIISLVKRPFFRKWRNAGFLLLLATALHPLAYGKYPSSFDDHPSSTQFRIPADTVLTVAWGGASLQENYHAAYPDQCHAYDLVIVHEGNTWSGDSTIADNYHCYGEKVLSPARGIVVSARDGFPDRKPGDLGELMNPFGNHIILQTAPQEFLFLAHLRKGTILVKAGQVVAQGQELARIGNSGHTSEPHLHMHLQSSATPFFSEGIPMPFRDYLQDGKRVAVGIPQGGFDEHGKFTGSTIQPLR